MIVEVVGCSVEDALAIERAGADRIELCAGIIAGGVTPSTGLLRAVKAECSLPVMAMIRPREGGFCYSETECTTMERELDELVSAGADGVVFGILHADGSIDQPRMEKLRQRALGLPVMCHRAFDVTPNPLDAIDALVDAGIDRVLSSGQASEILAGLPTLRRILDHAADRIAVQPCEGIRAHNVSLVVEALAPRCIHFGPFREALDPTSRLGTEVDYGHHMVVDELAIRAVVDLIRA